MLPQRSLPLRLVAGFNDDHDDGNDNEDNMKIMLLLRQLLCCCVVGVGIGDEDLVIMTIKGNDIHFYCIFYLQTQYVDGKN